MKKITISILALLMCSMLACMGLKRAHVMPPENQKATANKSTKPIGIADLDPFMVAEVHSPFGAGTCFPVMKLEDGQVVFITASHVVRSKAAPGKRGLSGDPYEAEELHVVVGAQTSQVTRVENHPVLDAALLWVEDDYVSDVFELRSKTLVFGEPVRATGWFLDKYLIVTSGNVGYSTISAPLFYGMSGGPILDKDNKVVGIMTGVYFTYDPRGIGHPVMIANAYTAVAEILDWLRDHEMID